MKKYYKILNKTFEKEDVKNYQELWEKVKDKYEGLEIDVQTEIKKAEKDNLYHVVLSTAKEDRHGEVVKQNWQLKNFKNNPVVLDSHNYNSIFHILGKMPKIGVKDGNLQGDIQFATMTFEGFMAEKMVEAGFVNTGSVGFIPLEFSDKGEIEKSELLEFSLVSVPANAEALFEKKKKEFKEDCRCETFKKTNKGFVCAVCGKTVDNEEKHINNQSDPKKNIKLEALKRIVKDKERRKKEILKESLAVIRRLQRDEVDVNRKRQMVNRVIRQLIKIK